jgi:hypothetical protein
MRVRRFAVPDSGGSILAPMRLLSATTSATTAPASVAASVRRARMGGRSAIVHASFTGLAAEAIPPRGQKKSPATGAGPESSVLGTYWEAP